MALLQQINVPQETVSDEFVTIAKLYVKNGDKVSSGDALVDLETSKTIITIEAEVDGFVKVYCNEGEDVKIGTLLLEIVDDVKINEEDVVTAAGNLETKSNTMFSKEALNLIQKHNLSQEDFKEFDFVNKDDVLQIIKPASKTSIQELEVKQKEYYYDEKEVDIKPISNAKKAEIKYLSDVQSGVMNSVLNVAVDIKNIDKTLQSSFKIFKDSYLPLIVYETSRLLKKYKVFNAYFMGDKIGFYKNINIGIAIDIDDGLKVLTLKNTDKLDMSKIETRLYTLIEKYLDKKLEVSDITGSTFTITDLSSSGVNFFTPLINTKQSAILGVSSVDEKLSRFYLTLVFDHRVTEGKIASEFLVELKNRIESYSLLENKEENKNENIETDIKCGYCFKTLKEDEEMQGVGMIKIINHKGKEDYICHVCLAGF